jgi:hypothetical protein
VLSFIFADNRIDEDDRSFLITNPPRRSSVWYGRPDVDADVRNLIRGKYATPVAKRSAKHDAAHCLKVELAAYDAVVREYEAKHYVIDPIWKREKCGWDLVATRGRRKLYIEVKGTSDSEIFAELTPNEFKKSKQQKSYRICIVTSALKSPTVHVFAPNAAGIWYDESGDIKLIFAERTAARLSAQRVST